MTKPRPSTAKISGKPCPDCGHQQLTDGRTTWCISGISHRLERELGLRRTPLPKGEQP